VNTEITVKTSAAASGADPRVRNTRGLILYDDRCAVCSRLRSKVDRTLTRKGFVFYSLHNWRETHPETSANEMALALPDGRMLGGAEALLYLCRRVWWLWPFAVIAGLPGVRVLTRAGYRWFAARRYRFGCHCEGEAGQCNLTKRDN